MVRPPGSVGWDHIWIGRNPRDWVRWTATDPLTNRLVGLFDVGGDTQERTIDSDVGKHQTVGVGGVRPEIDYRSTESKKPACRVNA